MRARTRGPRPKCAVSASGLGRAPPERASVLALPLTGGISRVSLCCSALLLHFPPGKSRRTSLTLSDAQVSRLRVRRRQQGNSHEAHSPGPTTHGTPTQRCCCPGHVSQLHTNLFARQGHCTRCHHSPYFPPTRGFFAFVVSPNSKAMRSCHPLSRRLSLYRCRPVQPVKYICNYCLFKYVSHYLTEGDNSVEHWVGGGGGVIKNSSGVDFPIGKKRRT